MLPGSARVGHCAESDDEAKVDFITESMRRQDFFTQNIEIDTDITDAIDWMAKRSAEEACYCCEFGISKSLVCSSGQQ